MNPFKSIPFLIHLVTLLKEFILTPDLTNQGKLYAAALLQMGRDASPRDLEPDDVACVESVTTLIHQIRPEVPIMTGTWTFLEYLKRSSMLFQKTDDPKPGCIIISPTGTGNGKLKNGHTGIIGKDGIIMSNDSASGLFLENYTLESWKHKYGKIGGFPVEFYRLV